MQYLPEDLYSIWISEASHEIHSQWIEASQMQYLPKVFFPKRKHESAQEYSQWIEATQMQYLRECVYIQALFKVSHDVETLWPRRKITIQMQYLPKNLLPKRKPEAAYEYRSQ